MNFINTIYHTFLDALFPLSKTEDTLLSYSPEKAYEKLPPAPPFTGLIVPLPEARSIFAYKDEKVSKLVWNIKYKKSKQAVKIGGYALYRKLTEEVSPFLGRGETSVFVPIPITPQRRRERGFNQCELLLDEIERLSMYDVGHRLAEVEPPQTTRFIFEKDLLIRTRNVSRQTLKNRSERSESAKDIFAVNKEVTEMIRGESGIVIIDDVITTGSTMHEAIETLKKAGFERVYGLSLAH